MEKYLIYLRKSRTDAEAEAQGEGETLARHEQALLQLAKRQHLTVGDIYREIVSGETIAARPIMQKLLAEVEQGLWAGVLVMEVERLARGNTIDQGVIAQAFQLTDTKIITPLKTYDPSNEFDQEYFEFGLFMSRREYKTINRRLQRGRVASVQEGKYVANCPPYGYIRVKLEQDKGWTLTPHPQQSDVLRMIFDWFTQGAVMEDQSRQRLGISRIARRLNEMGIPSQKGGSWSPASIRDILKNPVYIGKVRWGWRAQSRSIIDGHLTTSRPRTSEDHRITVPGLHPPLISDETFAQAQGILQAHQNVPLPRNTTVQNPLSGLVLCGKCGRRMVRRPYASGYPDTLMCPNASCNNVSSPLYLVENQMLNGLRQWLEQYRLIWKTDPERQSNLLKLSAGRKALKVVENQLQQSRQQMEQIHSLLEQGVYTVDVFLDRSQKLAEQAKQLEQGQRQLQEEICSQEQQEKCRRTIIPKAEYLLAVYDSLSDAKSKNDLLKEVLEQMVYAKDSSARWHGSPEDFHLTLYPYVPEHAHH